METPANKKPREIPGFLNVFCFSKAVLSATQPPLQNP
jgi:hypothetical protein